MMQPLPNGRYQVHNCDRSNCSVSCDRSSHVKVAVPIECTLVGCVETHPTKSDRVHLIQKSAEGAIANVTSVGGDRNANTVSQKSYRVVV